MELLYQAIQDILQGDNRYIGSAHDFAKFSDRCKPSGPNMLQILHHIMFERVNRFTYLFFLSVALLDEYSLVCPPLGILMDHMIGYPNLKLCSYRYLIRCTRQKLPSAEGMVGCEFGLVFLRCPNMRPFSGEPTLAIPSFWYQWTRIRDVIWCFSNDCRFCTCIHPSIYLTHVLKSLLDL